MGKIGITTIGIYGFAGAMMGMRAPMQSYHLSDSAFFDINLLSYNLNDLKRYHDLGLEPPFIINQELGEKDLVLAKKLIKSGSEHCKFRRDIHVQAIVSMPRYVWSEFDTYKIATVSNSESTMHKLLNNKKPITIEQFYLGKNEAVMEYINKDILEAIEKLEHMRQVYTGEIENDVGLNKNQMLCAAKRILPETFIQTRVIDFNYETIAQMYKQRVRNPHRLKEEWVECFGNWAETLLYADDLIICKWLDEPETENKNNVSTKQTEENKTIEHSAIRERADKDKVGFGVCIKDGNLEVIRTWYSLNDMSKAEDVKVSDIKWYSQGEINILPKNPIEYDPINKPNDIYLWRLQETIIYDKHFRAKVVEHDPELITTYEREQKEALDPFWAFW